MFTGIVVAVGEVWHSAPERLTVSTEKLFPELDLGSSIAVNGVCLTVIELAPAAQSFSADLSPETRARSNLGRLQRKDLVNLELPLRVSDRLGGHLVLGHVDALAQLISITRREKSWICRFAVDKSFERYLIEKGSIALDGISLTIFNIKNGQFDVAIIPHTWEETNLHTRRPGDWLNVEFDLLGKYVENLLKQQREDGNGVRQD